MASRAGRRAEARARGARPGRGVGRAERAWRATRLRWRARGSRGPRARAHPSVQRRTASREGPLARDAYGEARSRRAGGDLRGSQGRADVANRMAVVTEAAEQRADHLLLAEKPVPVVVLEVGREDGGTARVALLHQLEEEVRLLG